MNSYSKLGSQGGDVLDKQIEETMKFQAKEISPSEVSVILREVFVALRDSGYNPLDQLVGYLISGDPAYITNHQNARVLIRKLERDQILEELVQAYLEREGF